MKKAVFFLVFLNLINLNAQKINSASKYEVNPGDTIEIIGENFNASIDSSKIFIGSTNLKLLSISNTYFKFKAPRNITNGLITYIDLKKRKSTTSIFEIKISTLFNKADSLAPFNFSYIDKIYTDTITEKRLFADLNNDGINELIYSDQSKISVLSNKSTFDRLNFNLNFEILHGRRLISILDINSDGKLDIMTSNDDTVHIHINLTTGSNFNFRDSLHWVLPQYYNIFNLNFNNNYCDFNGDGRVDLNLNFIWDKNDPIFFLNKTDSLGKTYFKPVLSDSLLAIKRIATINLNNDKKTDLILFSDSNFYFLENISIDDSIMFKVDTSFFNLNSSSVVIQQINLNSDSILDFVVQDFDDLSFILNYSNPQKTKLKYLKNNIKIKLDGMPVFWDYNFDKTLDIIYTERNDTIVYHTLKIKNDSINSTYHKLYNNLRLEVESIEDVNSDNQPDIVCTNNGLYKRIDVLMGNAFPFQVLNSAIQFNADSINHINKDSIILTNNGNRKLIFDTIISKSVVKWYKSDKYSSKITFPLEIMPETSKTIYFSHKYTQVFKDTFWTNLYKEKYLGKYHAFSTTPSAYIKEIDKLKARPGDTITIKGNYFFKKITDISVRMNNRRCKILNSSKDTLLKFIYPKLTAATNILITDTAKKYNTYSTQIIYPTFNIDTSQHYNTNSYKFLNYATYGKHQIHFELPSNINDGHYYTDGDCYNQFYKDGSAFIGQTNLNIYSKNKQFKNVFYKQPERLTDFLYDNANKYDNLIDLNKDGLLDYISIEVDTTNLISGTNIFAYLCKNITDSSVEYSERKEIEILDEQPGAFTLFLSYTAHYDFDNDGINEIVTSSRYGDTINIYRYDNKQNKFIYQKNLPLNLNETINNIADYNNDGKVDLLMQQNYSYGPPKYYIKENISRRGNITFSNIPQVLLDSSYNLNIQFEQLYIDNDEKKDLIAFDFNKKKYYFFISDSLTSKLHLADSFTTDNLFYYYHDINGDGKLELFGKNVYEYNFKNGKFIVTKINIDSVDYSNIYITDADGDYKPDILLGNAIYFNNLSSARFNNNDPQIIETTNYNVPSYDSVYIYNNGSSNIHLKNLTISDTNYTLYGKNKIALSYPIKIKTNDSLKILIKFNPKIKPKKMYEAMLTGFFREDMSNIYKPIWGYVNLPPIITKVLPNQLIGGDTAAIFGKYFDHFKRKPIVNFANSRAEIISYNDSLMLVKVPYGCMDGVITVYDTAVDLQCFSQKPLQYTFIGTGNKINNYSFKSIKLNSPTYFSYIEDINSDGLPDILSDSGGYYGYDNTNVYYNQSINSNLSFRKNRFDSPNHFPVIFTNLFKDFDGDGNLEQVTTMQGYPTSHSDLYITGSFYESILNNRKYYPIGFNVTDINMNGKLELNFGNEFPQTGIFEHNLKTIKNKGDCNYLEKSTTNLQYTKKIKGVPFYQYDMDGDGIGEVIYNDSLITIAFNKSNKDSFHISSQYILQNSSYFKYRESFEILDYNNDGKLDIVDFTDNRNGDYYINIYKNNSTKGSLNFTKYIDTIKGNTINIRYFHFQDFNGDAKPDLFTHHGYGLRDTFSIFTNTSTSTKFSHSNEAKFLTRGKINEQAFADMNGDSKIDIIVTTDSCTQIFLNTNISGQLSRNIDTFNSPYGFPLSKSLALYSNGGDTLIIDKIIIPKNYKLVNSSGSLRMGSLSSIKQLALSTPIKINSQDSFAFNVVMKDGVKPGKFNDTIYFYNNESERPYIYIIKGEIKPTSLAYLSEDTIDFKKVKILKTKTDSFYIKNIGYDTLKISSVSILDTINFKVSGLLNKNFIKAGDSVKIFVNFNSNAKGFFNNTITINHNDYIGKSVLHIKAECITPVIIDSINYNFAKLNVYKNKIDSLYIKNSGNDTLWITSTATKLNNSITIAFNKSFPYYVLPLDSFLIITQFSPDTILKYYNQFSINHNGMNKSTFINFNGNGVSAKLNPVDTIINLGNLKLNKNYSYKYSYKNFGDVKLKIKTLTNKKSNSNFRLCNTNLDSLEILAEEKICHSLNCIQNGLFEDTLTIKNSGIDTLIKWYVKANIISPKPIAQISSGLLISNINKKSISKLTLYNNGTDTLFGITKTLSNNTEFKIIDSVGFNGNILPGKNQIFNIEFIPKDTTKISSNLNIKFANDTSQFNIVLKGKGLLGIPKSFSNILIKSRINHSNKIKLSLSNKGNYILNSISISNKNPTFNVSIFSNEILPKDSMPIELVFSPLNYQKETFDTLTITSYSDTIKYINYIYVKGVCLYPEISFSKTQNIILPNTKLLTNSNDSISIYNIGDDTLNLNISKLSSFEQPNSYGAYTIAPKEKLVHFFNFHPTAKKSYIDTLVVSSNAQNKENNFYIKGLGIFNPDKYKLSISKNIIDFGNVVKSSTKSDSLILFNNGVDTLNLLLTKTTLPFQLNQSNFSILPSQKKSIQISFNPLNSQIYFDTLFLLNLTNDTFSYIYLKGSSLNTSIYNAEKTSFINVYPNPTNDIINIEFKEHINNNISLTILDILGQKINIPLIINNNVIQVSTKNITNGIYFISIQIGNKTYLNKITILH